MEKGCIIAHFFGNRNQGLRRLFYIRRGGVSHLKGRNPSEHGGHTVNRLAPCTISIVQDEGMLGE